MSSAERSALFPIDDFSYPTEIELARYRQLEQMDEWHYERGNHRFSHVTGNHGASISPRQALLRYSRTPAGAWQAGQRARYPVLHANLDPALVDTDDSIEFSAMQQTILELIAHPADDTYRSAHRYGHPGFDIHPLGHMAQVTIRLDRLLMLDKASESIDPNPFLLQALRHTAALHDAEETEFPGIKLRHGSSIGDIGADVGKTDNDRRLGSAILRHVINATFHDVYTDEFREVVIALATHDVSKFDKQLRTYHAISEMNHEMNTLSTAMYLGKRGVKLATEHPMPANIMTALASDSIMRGIKKRDHLKEEGLSPEFCLVLTEKLRSLFWLVADRDTDDRYTAWRNRPAVIDKFGQFRPDSGFVRKALDE